jgi:SH3-like domain-containing protein
MITGEGLSVNAATQEAAKLLIQAFEQEIKKMVDARVAAMKKRNPSWCCQKCGDYTGWVGRFVFPFLHNCKESCK